MAGSKHQKMINLLNYRLKVTLRDGRTFIGQMIAFDKFMNLVISDCEEYRKLKKREDGKEVEKKRMLGLVMLRGEEIVTFSVEAPPPSNVQTAAHAVPGIPMGPGVGRPMGRGMPLNAPFGLTTPVPGVGGHGLMQQPTPQLQQQPMAYPRPPPGFPAGMPMPPPGFMPPPNMPMPPGFRPPPNMPMPPGFRPPQNMPFPPPPGFRPPPPS